MRIRFVNRTITNIAATCNIYDTTTKEITEKTFILPSGVTEKNLDKEITKLLDSNKRLLEVVTTETIEAYYRMRESEFIKYATIVPRKTTNEDADNE